MNNDDLIQEHMERAARLVELGPKVEVSMGELNLLISFADIGIAAVMREFGGEDIVSRVISGQIPGDNKPDMASCMAADCRLMMFEHIIPRANAVAAAHGYSTDGGVE